MGKKKKKDRWIRRSLLRKFVRPSHYRRYFADLRNHQRTSTVRDNTQLDLYTKILPGDFLHYGYFEDPLISPESLSLADIYQAQLHYAGLLLEHISDSSAPVLDVGCGMGGLLKLLRENGLSPTGLTPDRAQIEYIKQKYTDISLIEGKFEEIPLVDYQNAFGTVINSESLQYIDMETAVSLVDQILKPGGRWIVADYFRTAESAERSGFEWERFTRRLHEGNFQIVHQQDITANVAPTLAYAHMWGTRIGLPLVDFLIGKLKRKRPAIYYWIEDIVERGKGSLQKQLDVVDPAVFSAAKRYMLLVIEREPAD